MNELCAILLSCSPGIVETWLSEDLGYKEVSLSLALSSHFSTSFVYIFYHPPSSPASNLCAVRHPCTVFFSRRL